MATTPLSVLLFLSLLIPATPITASPYLSPNTIFPDYQKMLITFKIFIYSPQKPFTFPDPSSTLLDFHTSLLNSPFLTQDPNEAHLFFVPFPPALSKRSLSRFIRDLRVNHPYWNRTLGADHFFLSLTGIDTNSDRNVVELKKNSVQISVFPMTSGNFIPHKDITLPPIKLLHPYQPSPSHATVNETTAYLGFMRWVEGEESKSTLVDEIKEDPDFVTGSEPLDYEEKSRFCLFVYGGDVSWLTEAMSMGCVPVVITDRPIQDLPLMDVLRWSEMALIVGTKSGVGKLKGVMRAVSEDRYERMRASCVTASRHLMWNWPPKPFDAFHMVMYQLWLRRHTIRYAPRAWA